MSNGSEAAPVFDLAARSSRLKAFLVDAGLGTVLYLLMMARTALGDVVAFAALLALLALTVYQWVLLTRRGQTIGKQLWKIRIVKRVTGENGGFVTNVLLRAVAAGLLYIIPLYFFVDALFIFRDDRRCVHDFIAGTCVVQGDPPEA